MSEAIELYKQVDGEFKPTGVFYCSECRIVFRTEDEAKLCHGERICECGKKVDQRFYAKCRDCQDVEWRGAREAERFAAATKIAYADYEGGMLYDGDKYHDDLEALEDHFFDAPLPQYVWACKDIGVPKLYVDDVVSNIVENMWEDADSGDLNGMVELDTAIREFNAANESISVWEPDFSTAILLDAVATRVPRGNEV